MTHLAPLGTRSFRALLFDMDGTLITSILAAERVWTLWARRHGLDPAELLPTIHGIQAVATIRRLALPDVDPEAEAAEITRQEIEDTAGIKPIPGAAAFLAALPPESWAVVTSAPRTLARVRLAAAGLPEPPMLVSADDVPRSKPAPDGFLLAASRLGVDIADCLVFEDAPAGIEAALASGAALVVVTATHFAPHSGRHATIPDWRALAPRIAPDGTISLDTAAPPS